MGLGWVGLWGMEHLSVLISCSACQYSQFSKLEVSRSPSILCFVTKSLILGHGGQLLQAQYVVYYLKLLDQSQFLSPMQNFHFISPSRLSCAWACLHCSKCVNSIQEGGGEGAIASTISRQAGKPRCWSNNFTVADVTGEPRLHLFIHLLQLCINFFQNSVQTKKYVWGRSVIRQSLCFQLHQYYNGDTFKRDSQFWRNDWLWVKTKKVAALNSTTA